MDGLPAHCTKCGHAFLARGIIGGSGVASIRMTGGGTTCERCGGKAIFGDGEYRYSSGGFQVLSAPPITFSMIERISGIASAARAKAKEGLISADDILAEVADVSPELAKKLRAKHSLPVFALILLLLWIVKSVELSVAVDLNHMIDQAYHVMQGSDPESHLDDPVPQPNPPPFVPAPPERRGAPPSTLVAMQPAQPNRQARRRGRALARKRTKGSREA